jgi:hypothetical protein
VVLATLVASPARAQLAVTETADLRLVYINGTQAYLVPHAIRTFLNSLAFQRRVFGFAPWEQVTVLLADFQDSGNAATTVVPRNAVTIQIAPLNFAFETIAGNDRMNIIMNHELVHVALMDQAAARDRTFRRLFGGKVAPIAEDPESIGYFMLTTPRIAAPRWYHEGIATFMDTWMAGGLGRAQSGYDEMVFRSIVKDDARFFDPLGLASEGVKIDFQLQINAYLYGTRFIVWLARTYSPEKVIEWVTRHDGSRAYYASQFKQVFGLSLDSAWARWIAEERRFQAANLEALRKYPITPYADLTSRALGSISRAYYDARARTIYTALNYPGAVAHLGAISTDKGDIQRLVDIKDPAIYTVTSLARDPDAGTLFYTSDNGAYRDLIAVDPASRRATLLQKDARIGDLAFERADRSLWGIRQLSGLCTLVRMAPPYRSWQQVHTFPYGTVLYDLDVSPDGSRIVASFGEIDGKQSVRVLSVEALNRDDQTPVAEFDFGTAVPNNFVFSPDGRYLYGSSYYTGVSNIYRYDLASKQLDAVTNTDTGFFRPIPIGGDELIVFRYTGAGLVPARIHATPLQDISPITFMAEQLVEEHPVIKMWNVGSPAAVDLDAQHPHEGVYRLAGGLMGESFYPIVQGYKNSAAAGIRVNFSDRLQLNRLSVTATYSPDTSLPAEERLHASAAYDRYDWRARFDMNGADFYDLFGPTKVGRKGYSALLGHKSTLIFDEPRRMDLDLSTNVAANLDRLPEYQNIPVDVTRLYSFDAKLSYANARKSLGAVDDETGNLGWLAAQARVVDSGLFPKIYGAYDTGAALPAGHSSVWLRSAAGFSINREDDPSAKFYFGAFGNNYVDHGNEKRYREFYAFPGVGLNAVGGRDFVKSAVEWNLPPWRFSRLGTPGFYATWLRPAVFAGGLATDLAAPESRRLLANVGAQVDIQIAVLSELSVTLSVGGAAAFERDSGPRREAMISLKLLK